MKKKTPLGASVLLILIIVACGGSWRPADGPLTTPWTKDVTPASVWPEYPRPMLKRNLWLNLNGLWQYAVREKDAGAPEKYDGKILVPFALESALSGVKRRLGSGERLWYRRDVDIPQEWKGKDILLNFEAVDWETRLWVNGQNLGVHRGGYDPFSFNITSALRDSGRQEIVIAVWDPTDSGYQPRGKQVENPGGIFYTPVSGIWQTVWLEPLERIHIQDIRILPDIDREQAVIEIETSGALSGCRVSVGIKGGREFSTRVEADPSKPIVLKIPGPRLWSPDDPFLYNLEIVLRKDGKELDRAQSYMGMRKISLGKDKNGMPRIMLNNTFIFQLGPLDQGYWPDGLFTPPTEEAVLFDLNALKAYGFNMLRKHVKVESRRFYSLCDRLGLMVWQDMPSGDRSIGGNAPDIERTPQSARQYEYELRQMVETRFNHPSIVMWIPFNEGWGQFDTERIVDYIREIDPTRLIDNASGWADRGVGDIRDLHAYPGPAPVYPDGKRAAVLGEFGGLGLNVSGHTWQLRGWGYALYHNQEELLRRYERLYSELLPLIDEAGISGAVYTQLSDIESENNGLMTYDRKVFKVEPAYAALAHKGIFPPRLESRSLLFVDEAQVKLSAPDKRAAVRYTVDGSDPDTGSPLYTDPFRLDTSVIVRARAFYPNREESRVEDFSFRKVAPSPPLRVDRTEQGLWMEIFPGHWDLLPDFSGLDAKASRAVTAIDLNLVPLNEDFGLRFRGLLRIPRRGVYVFTLTSDDGSRLDIGGGAAIDLDGVHGARSQRCEAALEAGYHAIMLEYFQRGGGKMLRLEVEGPGLERQELPSEWLYYDPREIVR